MWFGQMEWKVATSTDAMRCEAIGNVNGPIVDPHVEPVEISSNSKGEVVVKVHQVVRDLKRNLLADRLVMRVFQMRNRLIQRFDIRDV
jgi:hypothetical protein